MCAEVRFAIMLALCVRCVLIPGLELELGGKEVRPHTL